MSLKKAEIKSIWEQQLNDVFEIKDHSEMDLFLSIISIIMFDRFDESVGKLYATVNDPALFSKIINTFSGMTLKIPERQDFKDAITLGLSYYYKEFKNMKWDEIKKELPYDSSIPIKTGKKLVRLNENIKKKLEELLSEE